MKKPSLAAPRVVLFSDARGWHERSLRKALRARGLVVTTVSLTDCRIGFAAGRRGLQIPGFDDSLPDAVFVRAIPAGSFEQVTFRLDILHALGEAGVTVCNPARVIERTVDKSMTSLMLARAGVATPPMWVCESHATAVDIVRDEVAHGRRLVWKPMFGSQGRGLRLVDSPRALPPVADGAGVHYLQGFVAGDGSGASDYRVMVIGGRAVAAMERRSGDRITNRARGASCHSAPVDGPLGDLALRAAAAVGAHYAGVDVIRDRDGRLLVLEINGIPAWKGLQESTGADIAALLAADLAERLRGARLVAV